MSIKVLLYLETAVRNSNSLARNEDNVESREPLLVSNSPNGNQYEVLLKMKKGHVLQLFPRDYFNS